MTSCRIKIIMNCNGVIKTSRFFSVSNKYYIDLCLIIFISDGDCKKAECHNRPDPAVPVAGAPAASGLGRGESETGHNDGTQRHYWGKCLLVTAIKEINLFQVNSSFYGANVGRSYFVILTAKYLRI